MTYANYLESSEIAAAFEQLLLQHQQEGVKIETKEEEIQKVENQKLLAKTSDYTVDNIVNGMAELQLSFGNVIRQLTDKLSGEANKLEELKIAIAAESVYMQHLERVRLVADALHIIEREYRAKHAVLAADTAAAKKSLAESKAQIEEQWELEQADFITKAKEKAELVVSQRAQSEADYQYELERQRAIEQDEYEQDERLQHRELEELSLIKEKDFSVREAYLAQNKARFVEHTEQITTFPAKLAEELNRARGKAIKDSDSKYQVAAKLQEQEWSATKQGYELRIASLTNAVEQQAEQVDRIATQLEEANVRGQHLAAQAFQNTAK